MQNWFSQFYSFARTPSLSSFWYLIWIAKNCKRQSRESSPRMCRYHTDSDIHQIQLKVTGNTAIPDTIFQTTIAEHQNFELNQWFSREETNFIFPVIEELDRRRATDRTETVEEDHTTTTVNSSESELTITSNSFNT